MNNTQDLTQLIEEKSVPVCEQWEVSGYERLNQPKHCVCGHKLRKLSFTIRNTLNGNTISPLGSGCIKNIGNRALSTEVNKLLATDAPVRKPCRVEHCNNTVTSKRYQMCTECKPKCTPAALEQPKVGENCDTFESIIRSNPKLAEWLLNKHYMFKQLDKSHRFYKTNNYRRAYAYNELEHFHPNRDT